MADNLKAFPISCEGGLDETATSRELQGKPGWASTLYNFEVSTDGGYRRINGYTKLGTLGFTPDLSPTPILGTAIYNNGFIICKGTAIYFTFDGDTFIQLNKQGADVASKSSIELQALPTWDRPDTTGYYRFEGFSRGITTTLIGVAEDALPVMITIEGTDITEARFTYKEFDLIEGTLFGANKLVKYKDQLVISGMRDFPTEIFYSNILKPTDFEGANAGSIGMNDFVTGVKMSRETLYVFCRNSIHKVIGLETGSPQRAEVTSQLGCVDGNSIQEIGGDLVFLGPDGLRTLAATDRISDVNLSTMSANIQGRLRRVIQEIGLYDVNTVVIRNKGQYRLFFNPKDTVAAENLKSYTVVMFLGRGPEGKVFPQFSELGGFDISSIATGYVGTTETIISGDTKGGIFYHDKGNTFDGKDINFSYVTPFFDMGDSAVRKTIHKIITRIQPEGVADFNMKLVYDNEAQWTYSPPAYSMTPINVPPAYGTATYATSRYGAAKYPTIETLTEGSGKVLSIRIFPSGAHCDPFTIQGYDIYFLPAGKL